MRILHGLLATLLLAPAALLAPRAAQAGAINYCVGGPISVGTVYTGAAVTCTLPFAGIYLIKAFGADGGNHPSEPDVSGGKGAVITGQFLLEEGDVLTLLVGGRGQSGYTTPDISDFVGSGGGGGSFVALQRGSSAVLPLLVAGGGGGAGSNEGGKAGRGVEGNPGVPNGNGTENGGAGGSDGSGGGGASHVTGGAGGGGVTGNGGNGPQSGGGLSFANGGAGGGAFGTPGCTGAFGGFGGGGAGGRSLCTTVMGGGGGGGGGYSGGGGGGWNAIYFGGAGGGGSSWYNLVYAHLPAVTEQGGNIFTDGQIQVQWIADSQGNPVGVPEPGTMALLGTGVLLLAGRRSRQRAMR